MHCTTATAWTLCHVSYMNTETHTPINPTEGKNKLHKELLVCVQTYRTRYFIELSFYVSSYPQLLRKRHIGNDIVTIIFQEPGALPFTPQNIRSHFQHVFVIVRVHNPCSDNSCYR